MSARKESCNQRDHAIHVITPMMQSERPCHTHAYRLIVDQRGGRWLTESQCGKERGKSSKSKETDERVERCIASQDQHGRHDQAGHEAEEEEVQARGDASAEVDYLEHSVHGLRHASSAWSIMFGETAVSGTLVT